MSLQETEKKLYQEEKNPPAGGGSGLSRTTPGPTGEAGRPKALTPRGMDENPFAASSLGSDLDQRKEIWTKEQEEKKASKKKLAKKILIVAGALAILAGIVWLALFIRRSAFSEEQVKVSLSGPDKVDSGESVNFEINYQNLNRASLENAVLYVKYSENFKPSGNLQFESEGPSTSKFNIGKIAGKKEGKVVLQGKFFGSSDALVYLEARLEYKPSTFNSTFTSAAGSSVFISSSPLFIEVSGPQNAAAGNAVSYIVAYENMGQEAFSDLKIKAEYPAGFSYAGSEPLPAESDNIWYVGNLGAGQAGQIKVNGTVNGARDEEKTAKFSIGEIGSDNNFISYGDAESTVKIIGSPILLVETINDKKENIFVNAGESLVFKINYKNTGSVSLRDVILSVEAASPVLDYSRIDTRSSKGEFDSAKKIITWKSSDIPDFGMLAPNAGGEIAFSVPVKSVIPIAGAKDKNFSFSAMARMDSPDIPTPEGANKVVASNAVEVKLNSKLLAGLEGFFNDPEMENSGPLPLKVGQETTFSLHLKVGNVSNDVTDAKVTMTLASGTKWKNNFLPRDASVGFNERTNTLVWNIGSIPAGTGITSDPKEFVFQIGFVPSQNQTGNFPALLAGTVFSAKDVFTGQPLEVKLGEKNTNLTEDLGVGETGKVSL